MASGARSIRVYLLWRNRMSNMFWKIKLSSHEIWGGFITAPLLSYIRWEGSGLWCARGSGPCRLHPLFKGAGDKNSLNGNFIFTIHFTLLNFPFFYSEVNFVTGVLAFLSDQDWLTSVLSSINTHRSHHKVVGRCIPLPMLQYKSETSIQFHWHKILNTVHDVPYKKLLTYCAFVEFRFCWCLNSFTAKTADSAKLHDFSC